MPAAAALVGLAVLNVQQKFLAASLATHSYDIFLPKNRAENNALLLPLLLLLPWLLLLLLLLLLLHCCESIARAFMLSSLPETIFANWFALPPPRSPFPLFPSRSLTTNLKCSTMLMTPQRGRHLF